MAQEQDNPHHRILVTGHKGFIGRALTALLDERELAWDGWDIAEMAPYGMPDRTAGSIRAYEVASYDVLINLAGRPLAGESNDNPLDCWRVNAAEAAHLFHQANLAGVPVVQASTAAADDTTSHYALAKRAAERAAALENSRGADIRVVRIHNVYGLGQGDGWVVPLFIKAAVAGKPVILHNKGQGVKDYIHVRDVAEALLAAAAMPESPKTWLHAATGRLTTAYDLAALIYRTAGTSFACEYIREERRLAETISAPNLDAWAGHWQAAVALEDGIAETVKAYRAEARDARRVV